MPSDQKQADSVFDIIYADVRRISSLLSQFNDTGIVTELSRSVEDSTSTNVEMSLKVVKAGRGDLGRETKVTKVDPAWLLPLLFLDSAKDAIKRDITKAPLGSLVLSTGTLVVTDLTVLQQLWKSPVARKLALQAMEASAEPEPAGNRQERRSSGKKKAAARDEHEMAMEIIPLLPHSPQINIVTEEHATWGTIDPQFMVGSVSDFMLKHGAKVPGAWSVVGILDGMPFEERADGEYDDILSARESINIGMFTDNIWKAAVSLAFPARQMLGRPIFSYGITPLVIFREIER